MSPQSSDHGGLFLFWEEGRTSQGEVLCGVRLPGLPRCYDRWCNDPTHVAARPRSWSEQRQKRDWIKVACPTCGASIGGACKRLTEGRFRFIDGAHMARKERAL